MILTGTKRNILMHYPSKTQWKSKKKRKKSFMKSWWEWRNRCSFTLHMPCPFQQIMELLRLEVNPLKSKPML